MTARERDWVGEIVASSGLTAGAFIVTLFGDVVEPRGGRLATGSIIEACARVGLNSAQVRTAISRLVAGGRLEGEREGRRSHYWLAEQARPEFLKASKAIFAPEPPIGWVFGWTPFEAPFAEWESAGGRRIGPEFFLAPAGVAAPNSLVFSARDPGPTGLLRAMARNLWPLDACEANYAAFEEMFAPLAAALGRDAGLAGALALTLRLLATHRFRAVALRDPGLPASALGEDWRGDSARALFSRLYLALSPEAEAAIPSLFSDGEAPLPKSTAATQARLTALGRRVGESAAKA